MGDRSAALDWLCELRIKSNRSSSSDFGRTALDALVPRFISAGRHRRRAEESLRSWVEDLVDGECFREMDAVRDGGVEGLSAWSKKIAESLSLVMECSFEASFVASDSTGAGTESAASWS